MSPNEFQLRSALRDGEGEHVNPDTVIARARGMQQARHDRRVRYASVAAVVAVVGGIGVVGGVALGGGNHTSSSASKNSATGSDRGADAAGGRGQATSSANPPVAPGPIQNAATVPCPDSPPKLVVPGGGGTGQFGATGSLFSGPVSAVKACAYASSTTGVVPSTVLTGENATDLAKSLDAADKTLSASIKCRGGPAPIERSSVVIIGVDKDGNPMKPVVVTLNCPTRVTNGTALRYNWTPPANITNLINQGIRTNPSGGPISLPPPGKVTGSPIRS